MLKYLFYNLLKSSGRKQVDFSSISESSVLDYDDVQFCKIPHHPIHWKGDVILMGRQSKLQLLVWRCGSDGCLQNSAASHYGLMVMAIAMKEMMTIAMLFRISPRRIQLLQVLILPRSLVDLVNIASLPFSGGTRIICVMIDLDCCCWYFATTPCWLLRCDHVQIQAGEELVPVLRSIQVSNDQVSKKPVNFKHCSFTYGFWYWCWRFFKSLKMRSFYAFQDYSFIRTNRNLAEKNY